jgi:protein-arginine kinase activator protein McsA
MVILRRRGDDVLRTLVCRECAGERARLYASAELDLGGLLARLGTHGSRGRSSNGDCELCGATLADIVTEGKPGCCLCYSHFQSEMQELIRDAQGHTRHVGKAPGR